MPTLQKQKGQHKKICRKMLFFFSESCTLKCQILWSSVKREINTIINPLPWDNDVQAATILRSLLWSLQTTAEVTLDHRLLSVYINRIFNVRIFQYDSLKQLKTRLQSLEKNLSCLRMAAIVASSDWFRFIEN